ncbi:MAG: polyprenyl synthetase family protein [Clostridiales bacterium]|jgi:heptaprenyl diphosphate synthase|nr:polyprenyl synthetase family protein [Clostridiales bacterium]
MNDILQSVEGLNPELDFVDSYINEFLCTEEETDAVARVLSEVSNTRGKMIRPLLLLLAARFGPQYEPLRRQLCKLGAVIEIVHMASLIHDDIIDDSPLRRGRPTVQQKFGKDMAVFAGDFLISRVMYHLAKEGMSREALTIGQTIEKMCRGELGQMACRFDPDTAIEIYLSNIYNKTVILFIEAMQLGAVASGCDEATVRRLAAIGEHLGYMFQIRDDLLDFISDPAKEGKPVHKDFADGIYTLPVLYALDQPAYAKRLREIAGIESGSPHYGELLEEMQELVAQNGGIDYAWQEIKNHAEKARLKLAALPGNGGREGLNRLICQLLDQE